ncbi:rab11 family-interacting protein 1 [Hypomesus transpacificus]|uniref:rab11 family-interacting protein 1 n=1 Tax=Hypomesus transpacificus TaxID=137520 RepID=UPI001F07AE5F|nr:rab11 family-interacting protein 1 [Hypomesus transpacificus]
MMSLIDLDDDQRWVPTHVNVTVLRAKGLRTKGKHGSRYVYTIIQVGKEKYTTGLVEKAAMPEWNEECCFELLPGILEHGGRSSFPPGSGDLVLTVMHRVLIGLDVFLGQAIIPLDKIFHDGMCPRDEWLRLNSKAGRKEKERGELQVTAQFTRNNMTASMFDLTMKDKPRSAFGKLKDRVTGRKRGDVESSSAIVPGRFAALSGGLGQPFGEGGGEEDPGVGEVVTEEKRSKMKDFFKGRLRRSSDTRSCSSLASENSVSSMASDTPGPPPCLDLLANPPSSPIYRSKVKEDTQNGEMELAKKVLTSQTSPKILTHKRAFSDEAGNISTPLPRLCPAVESLKGQGMTLSQSSLCINGSHVYSEPVTPQRSSGTLPSKLVLLEKCSPLSRSLQNLTKRSDDKGSPREGRRWSFDKGKKEQKEEDKEADAEVVQVQSARTTGRPVQAAAPILLTAATDSAEKGKKQRKTLFSGGRSDSLPAKSDLSQTAPEGRLRGWFGSGESPNKPRLEVSPKVESSSDVPPPLPPRSPIPPQCSSPSACSTGRTSPDTGHPTNPFTPSPPTTPVSPSNPFLPRMQCNPFFEELIAEETQRSPPLACRSAASPLCHSTASPSRPHIPSPAPHDAIQRKMAAIRRERPRAVARQMSLPALLPKQAAPNPADPFNPRSMSESGGELDESFDAFASSRLNPTQNSSKPPPQTHRRSTPPVDNHSIQPIDEIDMPEEDPPPLPPRRPIRTAVNDMYSESWLHRGQELAVHKEACLLSQTGAASLQHVRDGDRKRNTPSLSTELPLSSEMSLSHTDHSQPKANLPMSPPLFMDEDQFTKFKYEPLEDEAESWRGIFTEQDFCEPDVMVNHEKTDVKHSDEGVRKQTTSKASHYESSDVAEPKMLLDGDMSVADLLSMSSPKIPKSNIQIHDVVCTTQDPTAEPCSTHPDKPTTINNNQSPSLTLEDLNKNISNSDFSFIDSDGSSPSEIGNTLKGLGGIFLPPSADSPLALYHDVMTATSEDRFTLKRPSLTDINSAFEMNAPISKQLKVSAVCQENCLYGGCELGTPMCMSTDSIDVLKDESTCDLKQEAQSSNGFLKESIDFKETPSSLDWNGNPPYKPVSSESSPQVVSARKSLKGMIRELHGDGSPKTPRGGRRKSDFDISSSLVQQIMESSEGPLSYQPTRSSLSSPVSPDKEINIRVNGLNREQIDCNELTTKLGHSASKQMGEISFEDLHAKVAPKLKSPAKSRLGAFVHVSNPCASDLFSAPSLADGTNDQANIPLTLATCPILHPPTLRPNPGASATLVVAPYSSSSCTTAQSQVDARQTLLPEETQPASSLPHQESSPHPVKPLTTSTSQGEKREEKREGRSVLEKLKSTIHPGRSAQPTGAQADNAQEALVDNSAQYQHLTNMELIALLLQQEMDMEKEQAASQQQGALLEKREAELKKVKAQVRDLEDYIDRLLVQIMEQTPTLLQVRSRHK